MNVAGFNPVLVDPQLLSGQSPAASVAELAKRGQIRETAQKFEATFLSSMMQQMFQDVEVAAPFGGGEGEKMFKSFLTEAMAQKVAKTGGIGIAAQVQREMLKMQGLK
ncbi:rod-binding protein [Phenylobacterium sp. LjRoot225]|uniref:rod-binding protein n=1 Tax=Phenylobacterium sp. LjRoot225 TaxID=3342285 RepID=UPI003ECE2A0B